MSRKMKGLVCVAHPDDETIFFSGFLLSKKYDWTAVCVTDANADGLQKERYLQFQKACRKLGIKKTIFLHYPDLFGERLNIQQLTTQLEDLQNDNGYSVVLTHGPLGEYGHFHHQDVCYAVYKVFSGRAKIYSPAYNLMPDLTIQLSVEQYKKKQLILSQIYAGESMRFLGLLPATSSEGYVQLKSTEVSEIYRYVTGVEQAQLNKAKLKHYRWLYDYILRRDYILKLRPF